MYFFYYSPKTQNRCLTCTHFAGYKPNTYEFTVIGYGANTHMRMNEEKKGATYNTSHYCLSGQLIH